MSAVDGCETQARTTFSMHHTSHLIFSLSSSLIRSCQSSLCHGRRLLSAITPMSSSAADSNATPVSRPPHTVHDDVRAQVQLCRSIKYYSTVAPIRHLQNTDVQLFRRLKRQTMVAAAACCRPSFLRPLGHVEKHVACWNHFERHHLHC
jgi:hypothetical protein